MASAEEDIWSRLPAAAAAEVPFGLAAAAEVALMAAEVPFGLAAVEAAAMVLTAAALKAAEVAFGLETVAAAVGTALTAAAAIGFFAGFVVRRSPTPPPRRPTASLLVASAIACAACEIRSPPRDRRRAPLSLGRVPALR